MYVDGGAPATDTSVTAAAMAVVARAKRVTDPLDDRVRACLCGATSTSSGSEHGGDSAAGSSCSLSDLVDGFLFDDGVVDCPSVVEMKDDDSEEEEDHRRRRFDAAGAVRELISRVGEDDAFWRRLCAAVARAAAMSAAVQGCRKTFRRAVMGCLRDAGYNAAVCKTKWESSGGLAGGSHEFVDVLAGGGGKGWGGRRYIVELDFAGAFEIARPTAEFRAATAELPAVMVGRAEEVKQVVRAVAEVMRRSMKEAGMHLPPWRKGRYLQNKWLGPYCRTTSVAASPAPDVVPCRSVGFAVAARGAIAL